MTANATRRSLSHLKRALLPNFVLLCVSPLWSQVEVVSTNLALKATIFTGEKNHLMYKIERGGREVIEPSSLGIALDNLDLGEAPAIGHPRHSIVHETYPVRGVKAEALNDAQILEIPITSHGMAYTLEARAFNDGFAWRIIVPGVGTHHVLGESSSWTIPARSKVWYAERNNSWKLKSYAGEWLSTTIEQLPSVSSEGPVQAAPLVVEPPFGGYLLLTEAALANYSGMRLRAIGDRSIQADFTEGSSGFDVDGTVMTPWRVTIVAKDLDALVNSDILENLNPPADPMLFADQSYIRPGRAVWRFWNRDTGTPLQEKAFVDYAAKLGFEYTLVDDGWDNWPDRWQAMRELCVYAKSRNVGVFAWKDYRYLSNPANNWAALRDFLDHAHDSGLVGVKIDFINGESKERIDFERAALLFAAQRRLMVDFHGIQKPSGEVRTFPNAITREGIRGIELNRMAEGPITASHNAALPFTRFAVGYGDYTPLSYTFPGPTTWAHQLATVVAFTSPFITIAEDPQILISDAATRPGLDVLQAIPAVWDETRVLAPSKIGELAILGRRSGRTWFLAILNGKTTPVELPPLDLSFLGDGHYKAVILTSPERRSLARQERIHFTRSSSLHAHLTAGDGLLVWLSPENYRPSK